MTKAGTHFLSFHLVVALEKVDHDFQTKHSFLNVLGNILIIFSFRFSLAPLLTVDLHSFCLGDLSRNVSQSGSL